MAIGGIILEAQNETGQFQCGLSLPQFHDASLPKILLLLEEFIINRGHLQLF